MAFLIVTKTLFLSLLDKGPLNTSVLIITEKTENIADKE